MLADDSRFDLIVIGGGINGAAIAREAQLDGINTLLIEKDDFSSGTSATSTRLIHGGLRYLEHFEFSLVAESLHERERLLKTAPHLVEPLRILLPLSRSSSRGPLMIRLGMWFYDLLSIGKSLPRHRMYGRQSLLENLPGLDRDRVIGGAAYYDAQVTYPERLVLENALDAESAGATLANHTEVKQLIVEAGRIRGVTYEQSGRTGKALAPVVVNATGPWVDSLLGTSGEARLVGGTRGSHLIVRPFDGAPSNAVYAEATSDGRPFFVIPWNGLYLIGTTDERFDGDPGEARISRREFDYLVNETRALFPGATDLEASVCYTCSGIRPLPPTEGVKEGAITRRHMIKRHDDIDGLYSVIGGKLTTHRSLAEDCLRKLGRHLTVPRRSPTRDRPLPGALDAREQSELTAELSREFGVGTARRFWKTYGAASHRILDYVREDVTLGQRPGPNSDLLPAELVHAISNEHADSLIDLLQRRTMVGLGPEFGRHDAPLAADSLVRLGVWGKARADKEISAYQRFSRRHAVPQAVAE